MQRYLAMPKWRNPVLLSVAAAVLVASALCATLVPVLVLRRQRFADSRITVSHCAEGDCRINVSKLFLGDSYDAETITFQLTATGSQLSCGRQQLRTSTQPPTHWFGLCHGGGNAILLQKTGKKRNEPLIHGSVVDAANNLICQLSPDAEGINKVVCTPNTQFPPEMDPVEDDEDEVKTTSTAHDNDESKRFLYQQHELLPAEQHRVVSNRNSTTSLGHHRDLQTDLCASYLDIMVVWTARAECRNSKLPSGCTLTAVTEDNMRGLIDLVIAETNTAFQASGISSATLRLVHAYREPRYVEPSTNAYRTTVEALRFTDGIMDDVHTKRSEFGADLVAMLIDDPSSCGIAYRGPTPKDKMFSVTNVFCASGEYSFAHEVGHNLVRLHLLLWLFTYSAYVGFVDQGCRHDRNADDKCTAAGFAHGFRDPKSRFRSVMAYDCSRVFDKAICDNNPTQPCTRVLMFSNVEFEHNGMPIGNDVHNNARQVKSATSTVANHYPCLAQDEEVLVLPSSSPTTLAPTAHPTRPATSAPTLRPSTPPTLARTPRPTPWPTRTPTLHPAFTSTAIPTLPTQSPAFFPPLSPAVIPNIPRTPSPIQSVFAPTVAPFPDVFEDDWWELRTAAIEYVTAAASNTAATTTAALKYGYPIGAWNVSRVTSFSNIFKDIPGVATFNEDLSRWDVSQATHMGGMFSGAAAFNGDISSWNVGRVVDMSVMFHGARVFNQDVSNWDVGQVASTRGMFQGASAFNQDLCSWRTKLPVDCNLFSMFSSRYQTSTVPMACPVHSTTPRLPDADSMCHVCN